MRLAGKFAPTEIRTQENSHLLDARGPRSRERAQPQGSLDFQRSRERPRGKVTTTSGSGPTSAVAPGRKSSRPPTVRACKPRACPRAHPGCPLWGGGAVTGSGFCQRGGKDPSWHRAGTEASGPVPAAFRNFLVANTPRVRTGRLPAISLPVWQPVSLPARVTPSPERRSALVTTRAHFSCRFRARSEAVRGRPGVSGLLRSALPLEFGHPLTCPSSKLYVRRAVGTRKSC